jgi:hypothetical protein
MQYHLIILISITPLNSSQIQPHPSTSTQLLVLFSLSNSPPSPVCAPYILIGYGAINRSTPGATPLTKPHFSANSFVVRSGVGLNLSVFHGGMLSSSILCRQPQLPWDFYCISLLMPGRHCACQIQLWQSCLLFKACVQLTI